MLALFECPLAPAEPRPAEGAAPDPMQLHGELQLQRLLGGQPLDDAALDDLRQHTRWRGLDRDGEEAALFWRALRCASAGERQMIFAFVTSLDRLPPGGAARLQPPLTLEIDTCAVARESGRLPEAATCNNHLLVPPGFLRGADAQAVRRGLVFAARNAGGYAFA